MTNIVGDVATSLVDVSSVCVPVETVGVILGVKGSAVKSETFSFTTVSTSALVSGSFAGIVFEGLSFSIGTNSLSSMVGELKSANAWFVRDWKGI